MKKFRTVLAVGAGLFVSLNLFNATSTLAFTPDELSVIAAVEQTTPTPAADVPVEGTFYSAKNLDDPPLPGNVGYPAWNLGFGTWLVDDLTSVSTTKSMSRMSVGSLAPEFSGLSVPDTNGLWLEITNYDGNYAYLNLMNGTDFVYCVKSATDLTVPFSAWQVEGEMFPTNDQTNCLPFTVATLGRTNLFLKAEDWTGVAENGNTTPDWWFYFYYGTTALSDTNLDSQGNTLLSDYENGLDPNIITFTVRLGSQHFNYTWPSGQFVVSAGTPSYEAVLVNDTNLNDAVWNHYDGTVSLNLGATDGVYQVWIGLRNFATNTDLPVWLGTTVTLTRTPPPITITSPATNTVAQPYLQVQGYAPEELQSVTFDVSNAVGFLTNQPGQMTGHYLDTNLQTQGRQFTT